MNTSLEYILDALDKYPEPEAVKPEILITSGKHFRNWLTDHLTYNRQILINAIEYDDHKHYRPYEQVIHDIQQEFASIAEVKSLPFPYDDLKEMNQVIGDLIQHFNASFSVSDVIYTIGERPSTGYLVLTIVRTPVIS